MGNIVFIFFAWIVVIIVIRTITSGQRRPNSHINHHTMNASNFVYFDDNDTHHCHHHGHHDHGAISDFSHGDSGSCDSGGCDGGGSGCD